MSRHVLDARPGKHYEHTFIDDLESFFWVLFYTVAGYADPGVNNLTQTASDVLDRLDHEDLSMLRCYKDVYIRGCRRKGLAMRRTLGAFRNSWVSDPALVTAIVKLGVIFDDYAEDKLSEQLPENLFPKIVNIFLEALE
jgi:hypothetical protein